MRQEAAEADLSRVKTANPGVRRVQCMISDVLVLLDDAGGRGHSKWIVAVTSAFTADKLRARQEPGRSQLTEAETSPRANKRV